MITNMMGKKIYRPDIDGMRGLAILAVIIFHFFPVYAPSGFIGVDIFFVISGYLIVGNAIEEVNLGRFSVINFLCRRVKRIFPVLMVVLAASIIGGWFILFPDQYKFMGESVFYASIFMSNIHLYFSGDYFGVDAKFNALLNTWSLGVEEQFYLALL